MSKPNGFELLLPMSRPVYLLFAYIHPISLETGGNQFVKKVILLKK